MTPAVGGVCVGGWVGVQGGAAFGVSGFRCLRVLGVFGLRSSNIVRGMCVACAWHARGMSVACAWWWAVVGEVQQCRRVVGS